MPNRIQHSILGVYAGIFAFASWGLLPVYWKSIQEVPPLSIICHRMIWSCVFVAIVLGIQRRWEEVNASVSNRKSLVTLMLSGLLVGCNWGIYIWAVNNNHVVDAALGYYINPLCNVLLGYIFFKDRLRRAQIISILCAFMGVSYMVFDYGQFPWIALSLATTFSLYGLVHKIIHVMALPGLFVETAFLSIPASVYLVFFSPDHSILPVSVHVRILLPLAGVLTTLPLWAFTVAAKNLRLVTLGLLQFLSPTLTFLLGVFAYREPFTQSHLITFSCIWTGLLIYSVESWRYYNLQGRDAGTEIKQIITK